MVSNTQIKYREQFCNVKGMILDLRTTQSAIKFFSNSNVEETKLNIQSEIATGREFVYLDEIQRAVDTLEFKLARIALKINFDDATPLQELETK